ncbi:MAG: 3-methyl-2-oxobutanoate hydroxymethyltransferase [Chthoniobacterales bacterium]
MKKDLIGILKKIKASGQKLACLTAYDYPSARLLDESGTDLILVGDSLGMVVLGHSDTTQVTLAEIEHHLKAVRRGVSESTRIRSKRLSADKVQGALKDQSCSGVNIPEDPSAGATQQFLAEVEIQKNSIVAADLPAGSADTIEQAVVSSLKLQASGADMVKLEGAHPHHIRAIVAAGVPVIGHLGMLSQQVLLEGCYSVKGKTEVDAERLLREARLVEEAGASALVLELIVPSVARRITQELSIPTIGIGAGDDCDGQILVLTDLLGLQPWFCPAHVKKQYNLASYFKKAVKEYIYDTKVNKTNE